MPLNFAFELDDTLQVIAFLLLERLQLALYFVGAAAAFVDFVGAGAETGAGAASVTGAGVAVKAGGVGLDTTSVSEVASPEPCALVAVTRQAIVRPSSALVSV